VDQQAPAGLREQLVATIQAARRLVRAHVDLARAEAGEIVDEVKRMVGLALGALGLLLVVAQLVLIGGLLFVGEWLFGSIGWGVLHGALLFLDLALVLALLAVGVAGSRLARDVVFAALLGGVVGVALAFDLAHQGWTSLGDQVAGTVEPAWRAAITALVATAIVGAVLGFLTRVRAGLGAAFGAAVGGAVLGAIVGLISATSMSGQVGAALGVVVGLIAWPLLSGWGAARTGIDGEALRARLTPDQTIEQAKETIEWVRARVPLAPKS
jgi:hypothetical protein